MNTRGSGRRTRTRAKLIATMAVKRLLILIQLTAVQCFNTRSLNPKSVSGVGAFHWMTATPIEQAKPAAPTEEQVHINDAEDAFTLLASLAATTLLQSDRRRDAIGKDIGAQASSATNWIDEGSAFRLRSVLNALELWSPGAESTGDRERDDEAITWLRWMRSIPRPVIVDLSSEARVSANETVSDEFLQLLNLSIEDNDSEAKIPDSKMKQIRNEFLNRLGCRLILLPSGQSMQGSLCEPNGSLIFGKLLYGGVTRYRLLPFSSRDPTAPPRLPRRAGEKTERKTSASQNIPCWVQYGGNERKYDGVDMGPAMVLEVSLAPKIQSSNGAAVNTMQMKGDMVLNKLAWKPVNMFRLVELDNANQNDGNNTTNTPMASPGASTLQGKERNEAFVSDFKDRVGGLGPQIESIVRRVLDGRVIRPAETDANGNLLSFQEAKSLNSDVDDDGFDLDSSSKLLSMAALEAQELEILGLTPVRGLLLYGPPGNGENVYGLSSRSFDANTLQADL